MRQAFDSPGARIRLAAYGLLILAASTSPGCISADAFKAYIAYNDSTNDFVMGWRNTVWARQAWNSRKDQFIGEPQFHAFGEGFRDGYVAVASGGNGCPPPLPPRKFWNWRYQTGEGQAQVAAWFAGYPHGARAADEEGAGLYQQIQVSHPIEVQYSPEFQQAINADEMIRDMIPGIVPARRPGFEQLYPVPGQLQGMPDLPIPQGGASNDAAPAVPVAPGGGLPPLDGPVRQEVLPAAFQTPPPSPATPWGPAPPPAPGAEPPTIWLGR